MNLYEGIKDVARVLQKADNIDLYNKLLDLGNQALELQNELYRAQNSIRELESEKQIEKRIIRHKDGLYITLDGEDDIRYCSTCWGSSGKLIQLSNENLCVECRIRWNKSR